MPTFFIPRDFQAEDAEVFGDFAADFVEAACV